MPSRPRRALLAALGTALGAALLVVATATPAAAHNVDAGSLPAPPWLLGYLGAFAVLATALVLRSSWATSRLAARWPTLEGDDAGPAPEGPRATVGSMVALALLVGTVVAALVGENSGAANVAPVATLVVWWVGLPLVCLLAGDVLRVANPFVPLVALVERVVPRPTGDRTPAPAWTAGVMLWGFRWLYLAYYRPGSPRAVGALLVAYTLAAVAGGWWWGRGWLATGEGFGALSRAAGGLLRGRLALPRQVLLGVGVAWLAATAFDAVAATQFWDDVLGGHTGWTRTFLGTVGFVWVTAIVATAALGAARLADRRTAEPGAEADPERRRWLVALVGAALLPAAAAWSVAHDLTLLLFEGQNFAILVSDPLGRGWDLLGTIDWDVDVDLVEAGWVRVVQLGALLAGHIAAVVLAHDAALARLGRRRGMQVTWTVSALAAASAVAAALLVLE